MSADLNHDTIRIRKTIRASVEQVFAAWEDPAARSQWGPPSEDEAITFIENDFREGGLDVHLCGPKDDLSFRVETRYSDIAPPHRLVMTERVLRYDAHLSTSLISVAFRSEVDSTLLELTVQVASVVGPDMIKGINGGWTIALDNLAQSV